MKIPLLQPSFYDDFQCIGAQCQHSCCAGKWNICVDKPTYKQYQKIKYPLALAEKVKTSINLLPSETRTTENYAQFTMVLEPFQSKTPKHANFKNLTDARCPFLNKDNLCEFVLDLPKPLLCHVCNHFPRKNGLQLVVKNSLERFRTVEVTCEEVCRILDSIPEPLTFEYKSIEIPESVYKNRQQQIMALKNNSFSLFPTIRTEVIALLQDRNYSLQERLVQLGYYIHQVDDFIQKGEKEKIPDYTQGFMTEKKNLPHIGEAVNSKYPELTKLYCYFSQAEVNGHAFGESKFYRAMAYQWYRGMVADKGYLRYFLLQSNRDILLTNKSHFMEHLMVNHFFTHCFLTDKPVDPLGNYHDLIWVYLELQLYLAGCLFETNTLDDKEFYDLIVAFFRWRPEQLSKKELSPSQYLSKHNLNSMETIAALIHSS